MDFRWVAFITLWTIFGGPIMHVPPEAYEAPTAQEVPADEPQPGEEIVP